MMFQFKQFFIQQDKTAMKVGTDGVLLGAWASCENVGKILDVGSGTGLISIMLAQRNAHCEIVGLEIEEDAYNQSVDNVSASPWSDRISILHDSLQKFSEGNNEKFDLIVSNPPFFSNSEKASNSKRTLARHTDRLSFEDLVFFSEKRLSSEGVFSLIIPIEVSDEFIFLANENKLFLNRKTIVHPNFIRPAKRVLLEFSRTKYPFVENSLTIEIERHIYTEEYIRLTKDFYLKMI